MYDLDNIHPDHQPAFKDVLSMRAYSGLSDEQIQHIYNIYIEMNKIPKKDWNKPETVEVIKGLSDSREG